MRPKYESMKIFVTFSIQKPNLVVLLSISRQNTASRKTPCCLLKPGAPVEVKDRLGRTPLQTAVTFNQIKIVQVLLEGGADIETVGSHDKRRALHWAADFSIWHNLTLLLRKGAVIDAPWFGKTALHLAITKGSRQCAEILVNAAANVNVRDVSKIYPFS